MIRTETAQRAEPHIQAPSNGRRALNVEADGHAPRAPQPGVVFLCGSEFDAVMAASARHGSASFLLCRRCILPKRMRIVRGCAVIAVVVAAGTLGCSGSPTQPGWDGRVRVTGTVREFATSVPVSAATIVLGNGGAGDLTATTDAAGVYLMTMSEGMYHVAINGESIADVTLKDPTYRGDFYIRLTDCVGRYGMVVDSRTRQPVSGATLLLSGASDPLATTDQAGWFQWGMGKGCGGGPPLPTGPCGFNTYVLRISHPAYPDTILESSRGFCFVRRLDVEMPPR